MTSPEEMPGDETLEDKSFDTIVKHAVQELPEPGQPKDPYDQPSFLKRTFSQPGRLYHKDGRIEFNQEGDEVRRQWLDDDFELMFVHNTYRDETEFIVHEFAEESGLAARTTFKATDKGYRKKWLSGEYTMDGLASENGRMFSRYLDDEESEALRHIMAGAIERTDIKPAIGKFLEVTNEEQKMIDANAKEIDRRRKKLRDDLREFEERQKEARRKGRRTLLLSDSNSQNRVKTRHGRTVLYKELTY